MYRLPRLRSRPHVTTQIFHLLDKKAGFSLSVDSAMSRSLTCKDVCSPCEPPVARYKAAGVVFEHRPLSL